MVLFQKRQKTAFEKTKKNIIIFTISRWQKEWSHCSEEVFKTSQEINAIKKLREIAVYIMQAVLNGN